MIKPKSTTPAIVTRGLSKKYKSAQNYALRDLNISINPGEVYGFLGPNGAGKSTTIRLLMNFITVSDGSAQILGLDTVADSTKIKRHVGYLAGDMAVYPKMTGEQYLRYLGELHGGVDQSYCRQLAENFKADLSVHLGTLSRGNRQKIALIQAFMHRPDVLILDEPTSGLDPLMQEVFYSMVKDAKLRGAAIFMSSHILSEVQKTCDRVGIIRGGRLVDEQRIDSLAVAAAQTFDITFNDKPPTKKEFTSIQGLKVISLGKLSASIHMSGKLSPLLALLADYDVNTIDARSLDLEELFMHYYTDQPQRSRS